MNERIKQLAEQAGAGKRAGVSGLVFRDNELEKFAELIVRECLDQCYNRGMNDLQLLYAGQLKAAAYIKEHFGVEE